MPVLVAPTLAVDPGNISGLAFGNEGRLLAATSIRKEDVLKWVAELPVKPLYLYGELPQIYDQQSGKGDPNNLVGLAVELGMIAGSIGEDVSLTLKWPRQWKGNLPKDVCWARAEAALTEEELACIQYTPGLKRDDVRDAVALWLVAVGRLRLVK